MDVPILIISLSDAEARREPLTRALEGLGLAYQVFDGVDGRKGLPPEFEARVDRDASIVNTGRKLGDAEFAGALSHQEVYAHILEQGLPGAVVLEDDAIVNEDLQAFCASGVTSAHDLILLFHSNTYIRRNPQDGAFTYGDVTGHRTALPPKRRHLPMHLQTSHGAVAYWISAKGAAFLIQQCPKVSTPADWPCDIQPLSPIALLPHAVGHPEDRNMSYLQQYRGPESWVNKETKSAKRYLSFDYWSRKIEMTAYKRIS